MCKHILCVLVAHYTHLCPSVENTKREDITFIAFQIWLLGMSLVALLNESIPHMCVVILADNQSYGPLILTGNRQCGFPRDTHHGYGLGRVPDREYRTTDPLKLKLTT